MIDIRKGRCPLCDHDQIIEGRPVEYSEPTRFPLAITQQRGMFGKPSPKDPAGELVVYACRRCGFAQWFAEKPDEVPIGEDFRTRLIGG